MDHLLWRRDVNFLLYLNVDSRLILESAIGVLYVS